MFPSDIWLCIIIIIIIIHLWVLERVSVGRMPFQPAGIGEEMLESGNLFSSSWISTSVPLTI